MKKRLICRVSICLTLFFVSCGNTLKCERHFLPQGFTGKVTIFFNRKDGQKEFDKEGCIVYKIPSDGNCQSALPYKHGSAYPNETYKFFEVINADSVNQIFEFYENEYLKDTITNRLKKYIFFHSSGYADSNYAFEYFVDYGLNYKMHLYY
jgi:hypothetical protein